MDGENDYTLDEVDSETTCSICCAEFLDPGDLRVHVEQMHLTEGSKKRYCEFCFTIFSSLENYALHIRDAHLSSLKCCKYCTKTFIDSILHRKHESKHYIYFKKNNYSCSQCRNVFTNLIELKEHELKNHDNKLDGIMLHSCYSILSSILNMSATTLLQSLSTNTGFGCTMCNFTAQDINEYVKHLQTTNCQSIVCDMCCNTYKNKRNLARHIRKHSECQNYVSEQDMMKECKMCKKEVNALQLKQHVKICQPVKCNLCSVLFSTVYQLAEHQTKEHPLAISLTICQFCRREFVGTVNLQKHIDRVHKGDFHLYKYTCIYCENVFFKHPKDLFAHFFSKHQQLEPYCCKICNLMFRVRKKFTLHIKLDHKSVGFVEFDERYHVFFTDKKSENPFQPISLFENMDGENENKADTEGGTAKISEILETDTEQTRQTGNNTDAEQKQYTDKETDTETVQQMASDSRRKPPKMRFKKQAKSNLNLINMNSDFMSATEAEGNQTENDSKSLLSKTKRKRKPSSKYSKLSKRQKKAISETENELLEKSDISDDEPLAKVKTRQKMKLLTLKTKCNIKQRLLKLSKQKKKQLTCDICQKYCYTYQNYNHHRSLHYKNKSKKCIKCSKEFRTETELKKHVTNDHASSRLTETLRNLLERRKQGGTIPQPCLTMAERFQKTIKKVKTGRDAARVTLTEVSEKLSVQKFIENFTPDTDIKKNPNGDNTIVTVKTLMNPIKKPPSIKMSKFIPKSENYYAKVGHVKLAMPVRFKQSVSEKPKVNIKLVQKSTASIFNANPTYHEENYDNDYQEETFVDYEDQAEEERDDSVPDVAHEVMLENTEEPKPTVIPHKIVIPKLPQEYKQIRIAHLLPEAPYYKIVKVDDVLKQPIKRELKEDDVKLPHGTKLINVNPLAHLLDNKAVEKAVSSTRSKYYKPKTNNFEKVIAKALLQLENPEAFPRKKKGKKSLEVEQ